MLISSKLRPGKKVQVFKPPFLSQLFSFLLVHQIFTSWPSSIFPLHPRLHTDFCTYLHKHQKQEKFYQKEDLLIETKSFSLKLLNQRMWLKSTRTKIRQMFFPKLWHLKCEHNTLNILRLQTKPENPVISSLIWWHNVALDVWMI